MEESSGLGKSRLHAHLVMPSLSLVAMSLLFAMVMPQRGLVIYLVLFSWESIPRILERPMFLQQNSC
jgi:hypothetical protein